MILKMYFYCLLKIFFYLTLKDIVLNYFPGIPSRTLEQDETI